MYISNKNNVKKRVKKLLYHQFNWTKYILHTVYA